MKIENIKQKTLPLLTDTISSKSTLSEISAFSYKLIEILKIEIQIGMFPIN